MYDIRNNDAMDLSLVGQLLPAVAGFATAIVAVARGQRRLRTNIRHDSETVKELPADSDAYRALMRHIEWQVAKLHEVEQDGRRNLATAMWAGLFALAGAYATIWLLLQNSWWSWLGLLTAVITFASVYVLFDAASIAKRDAKGNKIKEASGDRTPATTLTTLPNG